MPTNALRASRTFLCIGVNVLKNIQMEIFIDDRTKMYKNSEAYVDYLKLLLASTQENHVGCLPEPFGISLNWVVK